MVPSLWGRSLLLRCDQCELSWRVDATQAITTPAMCWHCGAAVDVARTTRPADVVDMLPLAGRELKRGDIVVLQQNNELHVKRVLGLPGDTIELQGLRFSIQGQRLEDLLDPRSSAPTMPVDHDASRIESRWSDDSADSEDCWTRDPATRNWQACQGTTSWLVFHHLSVHDHQQPSPVWDDYPANVTLQRRLFPVDRLSVHGRLVESQLPVQLEIAFWTESGIRTGIVQLQEQEFSVNVNDAQPNSDTDIPVTEHSPIALRISNGPATIASLSVRRQVEYRLRPHDDRTKYPLAVEPATYFVLGDNVPVSIDSRDFGLIAKEDIVGIVGPEF
jgi:Signal peptidase, peptidase S26